MKKTQILIAVSMMFSFVVSCASLPPVKAPEFKAQKHRLFAQYPSQRIDDKIQKLGIIGNGPGRSMLSTQLSRTFLSRTRIQAADPGEIDLFLHGKTIDYDAGLTETEAKALAEKFQIDHILIFDDLTSPHADYVLGGSAFDRIDLKIVSLLTGDVIYQTSSYFGLTFPDPRIYGFGSVQEVSPAEFDAFRTMNFYNLIFQLLYACGEVQLGIIPKSAQGPYGVFDLLVGSPAEMAGLQREDHIIAINEVSIDRIEDLTAKKHELNLQQGGKAKVTVARGGKTIVLEMNLPVIPFHREPKIPPSFSAPPLSFGHDFHGAGVDIFSNEGEVLESLGAPLERVEKEGDGYAVTLTYPFGSVEMEGEKNEAAGGAGVRTYVVAIRISRPGVYGPRMTRVGDDVKSVLRKFPDENQPIENKRRKLYGDPSRDLSSGMVRYDDAGKITEISFHHGKSSSLVHWLTYKVENEKVSEIDVGVQTK